MSLHRSRLYPGSDVDLTVCFGTDTSAARTVLAELERRPTRAFQVPELVELTGLRLVEVMLVVARLTHVGLIDHPGPGRYRAHRGANERIAV